MVKPNPNEERHNFEEVRKLAEEKLMFKPRLKDVDGFVYRVKEIFPHHVLMETEYGYKRCFTFAEIVNRMV